MKTELAIKRTFPETMLACRGRLNVTQTEDAMTVTLKFKPDVEAGLLAQAQASGMTVEEYILSMVEGVVFPGAQKALSPEERAAVFEVRRQAFRERFRRTDLSRCR